MRGATTRRSRDYFLSVHRAYVASPFGPLRTEKTADFGVESRDPIANLCPSSKIPDFLRVGGGESKKCDFRGLGVGVLSFGYSLHTLCPEKSKPLYTFS